MFDDPKRTLQQMEQALKDAEADAERQWLESTKALIGEGEVDIPEEELWDRTPRRMADSDAVYVERQKRKGAGSLVILALLELIAILLVILWWLRWMG